MPELRGVRIPASLRESFGIRWAPRGLVVATSWLLHCSRCCRTSLPGNQLLLLLVLIYALIGVSLTILVGWAGQVSLGSIAIVGIGAFLTARWAGHAGWNVVDLVIVTGLAGAAVSVVIGLPALRIRGVTLAVVTLGFAVIAPDWLFQQQWLGGSTPFTTVVSPTVVIPRSRPSRYGAGPLLRPAGHARPRRRRGSVPAQVCRGRNLHPRAG